MAILRCLYERMAFVARSDDARVGDEPIYLPVYPGEFMHPVGVALEAPDASGLLEIGFERILDRRQA